MQRKSHFLQCGALKAEVQYATCAKLLHFVTLSCSQPATTNERTEHDQQNIGTKWQNTWGVNE